MEMQALEIVRIPEEAQQGIYIQLVEVWLVGVLKRPNLCAYLQQKQSMWHLRRCVKNKSFYQC